MGRKLLENKEPITKSQSIITWVIMHKALIITVKLYIEF